MILKLLLRNAFRHKLRAGLTLAGIGVGVLAFGLLRTFLGAWYVGLETSSANRLIVRNSTSLAFPLPISYGEKIRSVEGVRTVTYGTWFGGTYIDEKNFFANFAVDPPTYLELYPEYIIAEDQKQAFLSDRNGCIVGQKLLDRFGWKLGDRVTLKGTVYPGELEFVIRGIYKGRGRTADESQFFFHWEYLNETLKRTQPFYANQVDFYIVALANHDIAPITATNLDGMFKNSSAETLTETEKAFQMSFIAMADAILTAIRLVSLVIIMIIMVVVANTMAMAVRERMREYAILKTLGFRPSYICALIFGESLLMASLGGSLGILLTHPIAKFIANALTSYFPIFEVSKHTILVEAAAAVTVGVAAAVFPSWQAVRIRIAEGLRRVG